MDLTNINTVVGIVGAIIGVIGIVVTVISFVRKKTITISTKTKLYVNPGGTKVHSSLIIQIITDSIPLEVEKLLSKQNGQKQAIQVFMLTVMGKVLKA